MKLRIAKEEDANRAVLFSGNLRFMLDNGPINRAELARRIDVSANTVGMYALGRIFPSEERIEQIANALGCTVEELFDDTYAPWKFGQNN